MPKASQKAASTPEPSDDVTFEEALTQLEATVESMESGELPLEDLLRRYEDGARLARACQQKLEAAERRIRTLEESASGALTLSSADADINSDE